MRRTRKLEEKAFTLKWKSAYLPELPIAVGGRGGREHLRPQEHEKEVVRGGWCQAPRRGLLQVGSHRCQAPDQQLFRFLGQELIGGHQQR